MKAHLAMLPLSRKTKPAAPHQKLVHVAESASSSSASEEDRCREAAVETEEKSLAYTLRNNPKRSFRIADPEFSFNGGGSVILQDRESENESRRKNPTKQRSKRNRPSSAESTTELEPVSSVSDTSPEEDVAICLMMLSRDVRLTDDQTELRSEEISKIRGKYSCGGCDKLFRSYKAMDAHRRVCEAPGTGNAGKTFDGGDGKSRIFECPFCCKVFGSGQALGGHKRSHLLMASSSSSTTGIAPASAAAVAAHSNNKFDINFIDLNLPAAPVEEDNYSVVSDA